MIDKFTIGILLLAFVLSVSITVYEAGRVKELESRVSVLAVQMAEAEKKQQDCKARFRNGFRSGYKG